jgi:hypothetical protein
MEAVIFRMTKPSQYAGAISLQKIAKKRHLALAWPKSLLNLAILTGDRACSVSFVEVCHREFLRLAGGPFFSSSKRLIPPLNYGGLRVPQSCDKYVASHCNPRDVFYRIR